ncbi:MAG: M56 family metallopeptidase [Anaerolineae bacterium]
MEPAVAAYEAYHFHLLYDAVLSAVGFVVVLAVCRGVALHDPQLRVRLFALVIGLPVLGELIAYATYRVRPAPHTSLGQAIFRFHEECGFCALWDEPQILGSQPRWVLSAMLLVVLFSFAKNGLGTFILGRLTATYPPFPIDYHSGFRRRLLAVTSRCGAPVPRIAVSPHAVPLALSFGIHQPTIIISQGMLAEFSRAEMETVLAHELAHTIRRDNLWNWLLTLLRDALFFLPTSHLAWRQMVVSQEEACDDLTITWTERPLDLARSLVKAWQYPRPRDLVLLAGVFLVTPFFRRASAVERRVERIVLTQRSAGAIPPPNCTPLVIGTVGLLLLLYALPIAAGS